MPFATTEARTPLDDLAPLRNMIGDARLVLLGEATHGSREFFTMKHRIVELLVRDLGFTVFAIEAHLAEVDRINEYVINGTGDPDVLLRELSMWSWHTDEVADLIRWIREYNLARGERPAVSFRGFDMQRSDTAMRAVEAYLQRVAGADAQLLVAQFDCFETFSFFAPAYRNLPAEERDACAARVASVHEAMVANRDAYIARSSVREYDLMLRYARVIVQHEAYAAPRPPMRDVSMAENATWLAEVLHRGEKIVYWAHNNHVTTEPELRMGHEMRKTFAPSEMVTIGFVFDRGDFWAHGSASAPNRINHIDSWQEGIYEPLFRGTGHPLLLIDLRNIYSSDARRVFGTTSSIWRLGGIYDPAHIAHAREQTTLSKAFDIVIWIETVTPSRVR